MSNSGQSGIRDALWRLEYEVPGLKEEVLGEPAVAVGVVLPGVGQVGPGAVLAGVELVPQAVVAAHARKEEGEDGIDSAASGGSVRIEVVLDSGYTLGMKTAVSIPDDVFERVERLARGAGRSRSEVFSEALREYLARHAPDEVTEAMDRVCAAVEREPDAFLTTAGRRVLETTEW